MAEPLVRQELLRFKLGERVSRQPHPVPRYLRWERILVAKGQLLPLAEHRRVAVSPILAKVLVTAFFLLMYLKY